VAIGELDDVTAAATVDARGQFVAPGFIDLLGWSQIVVLNDPHLEAAVRQGITTQIAGEGESPGPRLREKVTPEEPWQTLGDFLDLVDQRGSAVNFALLVGSSNPRAMVIGNANRPATAGEMRQMEEIVDQAMREGAIGLSTSLIYVPAVFSTTDEIVRLARVAASHGGVYFSHIRNEGDGIHAALEEAFHVGRESGIPVNIWHLKIGGRNNWGTMPAIIDKIAAARASGLDVSANVYPYAASSTSLSTLAPDWALEGGYSEFRKRLAIPEDRARILEEFRRQFQRRGERGIYVSQVFNTAHEHLGKKFLEEIAAELHTSPEEALAALFAANEISPRVIYFSMFEDDVRHALSTPWVSVGSDASVPSAKARAENTSVHPRAYGTFPRVIGHYGRDLGLFPIEEAVRKITSQAAARANLQDRGILREGMKADIVVFDPATIRDLSTFEDPHRYSEGVLHVIVNGIPVLRDGTMTGALPGRTIRGAGYRRTK
jgi:N-acyl-D-aspartate/D-glutamate deacylase